jgi:hypothetical protein
MRLRHFSAALVCLAAAILHPTRATAAPSIVVSVPDQSLALIENGVVTAKFPVSTSKFGLGDNPGSYATPLGSLEIASKIGANAPLGAVFKSRAMTGEVLAARSGKGQCPGLRAQHLHPRNAGGTAHRATGQLRLHPDAFGRCGAALWRGACRHQDRYPERGSYSRDRASGFGVARQRTQASRELKAGSRKNRRHWP